MRPLALSALIVVLACSRPLSAQTPEGTNRIDSAAVAAFADEFLPREMARRHIPGLVFVLVADGEITVARGFGAAQLEPRRPVEPDRTVFRLASVSKTITATAALQLVEQGRLDLHTDVNTYLNGFQVAHDRGPVTLHHLLTHTAGFDERLTGVAARSAQDLQPLRDYLARSMPPTFIEPGRVVSYSNHGFALVGLLVQEKSGRPFADYIREQIFEPLGMQKSGSLVGWPPTDLAVAYEFARGRHRALSPEYLQVSPAGAFFTTGTDMGHFLIAHLRGGAYQNRRILQPETVALMHARQFAQTSTTSGWAYGLWEDTRDGQRALLHNGGGKGYRALLYLLPQQDAGFFLAYNLADTHRDGELQEVFITQFRHRFVPQQGSGQSPHEHRSTEQFAGDYLYVRRARTTMEKMISAVNGIRIVRGGDGTLIMTGASNGPVALRAVGPRLFRRADDRGLVAFDAVNGDRSERLVVIADSGFPAVYERIPFVATLRVQLAWLSGMMLVLLHAAVLRPLLTVLRRRMPVTTWRSERWSAWLGGAASALTLLFLIAFPLAFLGRIEGGLPEFVYGVPLLATRLLLIPPIVAVMGIATSFAAVRMWFDGRRASKASRFEHSLVSLALLSFAVFALYWHLMRTLER